MGIEGTFFRSQSLFVGGVWGGVVRANTQLVCVGSQGERERTHTHTHSEALRQARGVHYTWTKEELGPVRITRFRTLPWSTPHA